MHTAVLWYLVLFYFLLTSAHPSSQNKKRKVDFKYPFKTQWNVDYFIIKWDNKALCVYYLCLFCVDSVVVLKEYNICCWCHHTKHPSQYSHWGKLEILSGHFIVAEFLNKSEKMKMRFQRKLPNAHLLASPLTMTS